MAHYPTTPQFRTFAAAVKAGVPTLFWGGPGEGKSAKLIQYGEKWGMDTQVLISSIRDPQDFLGLPYLEGNVTHYADVDWAVRANAAARAMVIFDELSTARPEVQAPALRVFQERVVGNLPLNKSVTLCAAANPSDCAADGFELAPPLANRFCHLDWPFDADEWAKGMMIGFDNLPVYGIDQLASATDGSRAASFGAVIAFTTKHRPDMLRPGVPKNAVDAGKAWASPRSWTNAASVLGELTPGDTEARMIALQGLVGQGAAHEFIAWEQTSDLPDVEAVLANPSIVDWKGERPDRLFALCASLGAVGLSSKDKWEPALLALTACGEANKADVAMNATDQLLRKIPAGAKLPQATRKVFVDLMVRANLLAAPAA